MTTHVKFIDWKKCLYYVIRTEEKKKLNKELPGVTSNIALHLHIFAMQNDSFIDLLSTLG